MIGSADSTRERSWSLTMRVSSVSSMAVAVAERRHITEHLTGAHRGQHPPLVVDVGRDLDEAGLDHVSVARGLAFLADDRPPVELPAHGVELNGALHGTDVSRKFCADPPQGASHASL